MASDCDGGHWGSRLIDPTHPTPNPPPPECGDNNPPSDPFGPMTPVSVNVNGKPLQVKQGEQGPYMQGGRVFVPIRYVAEALGAAVTWHQQEHVAVLEKGKRYVTVWPNATMIRANDWNFSLEAPARMINDRLFVPIRYVVEALGGSVTWDSSVQQASVSPEPTKFEPETFKDLVLGVIKAIADQFWSCDHVLCLDRDKLIVPTTPAIWEQTYAHIDAANDILKAARDVGDRMFVRHGKLYFAKIAAAGVAIGATVGEVGNNMEEFVRGLHDAGLTTLALAPELAAPAVVIGVLSVADTAGMSADEEDAAINQFEVVTAAAMAAQANGGYKRDRFNMCTLFPGDLIYAGAPVISGWFVDARTALKANVAKRVFDAVTFFTLAQVQPSQQYGGYRKVLNEYKVIVEINVACGTAANNQVVDVNGFGPMFLGLGGACQFLIPEWETIAVRVDQYPFQNWEVKNWDPLRAGTQAIKDAALPYNACYH
ncbi:MAG TPA: copper amine oxidase N-terminal domain-containing protein [Symbiobacteriaceae bacterium]|jgi:hypothetical protein